MEERKSERRTKEAFRAAGQNARETANRTQESASRAAEGFREYQLKLVSAAQENANAFFQYAQEAVEAQSISDLIEICTDHSRRQAEMMAKQARELTASAQKIAGGTAWPLTSMFNGQGGRMS